MLHSMQIGTGNFTVIVINYIFIYFMRFLIYNGGYSGRVQQTKEELEKIS